MMWGWGYGTWSHWAGWLGPLFMMAVGAAIVTGGVLLIRSLVRGDRPRKPEDSALEVLRLRYARGEIQKQEYEEKREDLS